MPSATKNVPMNTITVIASRSASDTALNIRREVYQKRSSGTAFLCCTAGLQYPVEDNANAASPVVAGMPPAITFNSAADTAASTLNSYYGAPPITHPHAARKNRHA